MPETKTLSPQCRQILGILRAEAWELWNVRNPGHLGWVQLPEILALGIAQYNARIHELRAAGYNIECRKQRVGGQLRTAYRLVKEKA